MSIFGDDYGNSVPSGREGLSGSPHMHVNGYWDVVEAEACLQVSVSKCCYVKGD